MPSDKETLAALIEAGEKASKDRWAPVGPGPGDKRYYIGGSSLLVDYDDVDQVEAEADGVFAAQAANARPALKRMVERLERLEKLEAEAEAQRAVLVAALEEVRAWREPMGPTIEKELALLYEERDRISDNTTPYQVRRIAENALANQPPSDLVALVKAADDFVAALDAYSAVPSPDNGSDCDSAQAELEGAIDTLLQNQPGFRALIDGEDV